MDETSQTEMNPPYIHIYKVKPWVILLNVFSLLLVGSIIAFPVVLVTGMLASYPTSDPTFEGIKTSLLCAFAPLAAALVLIIIQQVAAVTSAFYSYIKVSPDGIENKIWPYRHIRANWSQVERLGQFFFYEVVYLKTYEVMGLSLSHSWPLKFLNMLQPSIALSTYNGWPNGELASDLRRFAPGLFENRQAPGEAQARNTGSRHASAIQQTRLLAALAHASVLFSGIGTVIPLVIYLSQKGKSAYLSFQALQAFIYQLVGIIIGILFPFCIVGAVIVSAIGTTAAGNESTTGPIFIITMGITGAVTVLVAFGSLVYAAYGMIAAILTYQGKDFQYVIIGKRLKRSG